jgi:DNA-3-methyladenine glycosylase I
MCDASRMPASKVIQRCSWAESHPLLAAYHDEEWGVPIHEDRQWYEKLVLDGAQAGLSWLTILKKREGYREAFANFEIARVANFDEVRDVERLLLHPGIVRNRAKIRSAIVNARALLELQREFGSFDAYIWAYVDGKPVQNCPRSPSDWPARTPLSDAVSKDLKKRGFSFVGSTIVYAFLQAAGVVNDHLVACFRSNEVAQLGDGARSKRTAPRVSKTPKPAEPRASNTAKLAERRASKMPKRAPPRAGNAAKRAR